MNLRKIDYILAVAEYRHFELAAEKCYITQSTLSTMIAKFEDEIGLKIFDRKKKPLDITQEGHTILGQLRTIRTNFNQLEEMAHEIRGEIKGKLSISVIPTIAPYLLPLFLPNFVTKYPQLQIEIREQTTDEIIRQLRSRAINIGILSTPLYEKDIIEYPIYDEPFLLFDTQLKTKNDIELKKLAFNQLCLLEEGHCMRTQVLNLCELHKKKINNKLHFDYKAGSIDSLLRFVKASEASTLLPFLAAKDLPKKDTKYLHKFSAPIPMRTIGLVVHQHFVKKNLLLQIEKEIKAKVLPLLPEAKEKVKILEPR
ncbi:MAG: LysR substrate-binding domain-containing protein [Chitinophagales bacterium]|jgi:LysR family hydrogen peroxide-inducible transcriptional activator|nr:LysR substrate-binding domain-containing protein [Sphingobacteriales bacterium]